MVDKMHNDQSRSAEEETLDRAMTSIDPLLQASLQRDQKRRRKRLFLVGALAMTLTLIMIAAFTTATPDGKTNDPIENATRATALAQDGWQLWQKGKAAEAEVKFIAATKLDAKDPNTWNGLGWAQIHQSKLEKAYQSFRRCLELQTNHGAALNGAGQVQLRLGKLDAAERYFRRGATTAPAAHMGLIQVLLIQEKFDDAIKQIDRIVDKSPSGIDEQKLTSWKSSAEDETVPADLAQLFQNVKAQQVTSSDVASDVASDDDLKSAVEANRQGWQLFSSGKMRPAELAFRKALKHQSGMKGAQNGLGFCLLNQGKPAEALEIFESLVESDPKHAGFVNGLARSHEGMGNVDKAIEIWQAVDDKSEVNAVTWGLARALMSRGDHEQALGYWERIDDASPGNDVVKKMIAQCKSKQDRS